MGKLTREDVRAMDQVLEGQFNIAQQQNRQGLGDRLPTMDTIDLAPQTMEDAFPTNVDPHLVPFGQRVLVQMRRAQSKTLGGIALPSITQSDINWNQQVAKVIELGGLAFRNRETLEVWGDGEWAKVGDFVRVPRWNGDRIVVEAPDGGPPVTFVTFNDYELMGRVTGDPLKMKIYIL